MATCNNDCLYTEPTRAGQSSPVHNQHLYHSEPFTPAHCVPLADFLSMQSAAQGRILKLETELALAISERTTAEQAAQYMLKIVAAGWRSPVNTAGHGQDLAVQHDIASIKTEIADLREKIYETTSLCLKAFKSCPAAPVEMPCPASKKGFDFVDLLDMDGQGAEPHSGRGSSSDVDMEELVAYTKSLPKIDLSAAQGTIQQTNPSASCLDVLPSTESPIVRRFRRNTSKSSAQIEADERLFDSPADTSSASFSSINKVRISVPKPTSLGSQTFMDRVLAEKVHGSNSSVMHMQPQMNVCNTILSPASSQNTAEILRRGARKSLAVQTLLIETSAQNSEENHQSSISSASRNDIASSGMVVSEHTSCNATCGLSKLCSTSAERHDDIIPYKALATSVDGWNPEVHRYGIRFMPSAEQTNTFKTVSIMNLPSNIEMPELMNKIRGGAVVSCQVLDTVSISKSFSALVQFLHEQDAIAYEEFTAAHPIYFAGQRAHVKLIQTPSWPIKLSDKQHTRCLKVYNFPTNIKQAQLRCDLLVHKASRITSIEHVRMRHGQVLDIRFSSIKYAENALHTLNTKQAYKQCHVTFSTDPCTKPLETLLEDDMIGATERAPLTVACQDDNQVESEVTKLEAPTALRGLHEASISPEHTKKHLCPLKEASSPDVCPEQIQSSGASTSGNSSALCPSTQEAEMVTFNHTKVEDYCLKEMGADEYLAAADMPESDQSLALADIDTIKRRNAAEMASYQNDTLLD